MREITRQQFSELVKTQRIKQRLSRELRFLPEEIRNWDDAEMLAVKTRGQGEGLLIAELDDLYVLPYELTVGLTDKTSGRSKPITCDFCVTWQSGSKAGRITFERQSDKHKFSYLCCADLQCSLHVRDKTAEAVLSRAQLREDITTEQRIDRLHERLKRIILKLESTAVETL